MSWPATSFLRRTIAHSGALASLPDFFAGPSPGPVEGDERVPGGGVGAGAEFEEILDFQAAVAQQPDHLAVAQVELHRLVARPFEPVHAEVGPHQPLGGGPVVFV